MTNLNESEKSISSERDSLVLSIGDAHNLAPENIGDPRDRQLLKDIYRFATENKDILGDDSDYHNLSATYAKSDDYLAAFGIVEKGLTQYPYSIDLLADALHYGSYCMKTDKCEDYLEKLLSRPFSLWNWRTFTFVIDYFLDSINWIGVDDIKTAMEKALNIAKKYQETLPHEERSYFAEADIYLKQSSYELAESVLHKAVFESGKLVSPQCCMKLADILSEKGEYDKVIEVVKRGLTVTAQDQPSVRTGYLCYLSALAKDALINQEQCYDNKERVADAFADYRIAFSLLGSTPTYISNIQTRTQILSVKSGVQFKIDSDGKITELLQQMQRLGISKTDE
jgi:tetratricopeptide (TPR) repeat protein